MTDKQAIADALQRLADIAERAEHWAPRVGLLVICVWGSTLLIWALSAALRIRALGRFETRGFSDEPAELRPRKGYTPEVR